MGILSKGEGRYQYFRSYNNTNSHLYCKGSVTHDLVQWEEPGSPHSVVEAKAVSPVGSKPLQVGYQCRVAIGTSVGKNKSAYSAQVIAMGE